MTGCTEIREMLLPYERSRIGGGGGVWKLALNEGMYGRWQGEHCVVLTTTDNMTPAPNSIYERA